MQDHNTHHQYCVGHGGTVIDMRSAILVRMTDMEVRALMELPSDINKFKVAAHYQDNNLLSILLRIKDMRSRISLSIDEFEQTGTFSFHNYKDMILLHNMHIELDSIIAMLETVLEK